MVGGIKNNVVEWHTGTCHHCGVYCVPADRKCADCGVQVHDQCVQLHNDRCDMCSLNVPSSTLCALCECEDPVCLREDATDRLLRKVVCFGRTWSVALVNDEELLAEQGYIFVEGFFEQEVVYDPLLLPHSGKYRMFARSKHDDRFLVSDPSGGAHLVRIVSFPGLTES